MSDLKTALLSIFPPAPKCPPNKNFGSIAELYEEYLANLEDTCVVDICGQKNWFRAENFPHLVKLEFYNAKVRSWVDAVAAPAIKQLKDKTLNESLYRIGDRSRPRTLFWLPELIRTADNIHPNIRSKTSDVYSRRYTRDGDGADLKIALVETRRDGDRIIKTSFWSNDQYHKGCVGHPPKHPCPK